MLVLLVKSRQMAGTTDLLLYRERAKEKHFKIPYVIHVRTRTAKYSRYKNNNKRNEKQ